MSEPREEVLHAVDVAVVMSARNEERYIERALRSCVAQSLEASAFEIIVVDDASSDATARIAERFDVQLLRNERQLGLPASINRAVRAAQARYVVRVDADDYIHNDFLRVLRLFLDLNPYMHAIACDYLLVDENEEHLEHVDSSAEPIGCGIMFRKDRLIEIGLYDESFLMAEEVDLRMRFEKHWPMHRCELPLYRYRRHGENMTGSQAEYEHHKERARRKNRESE
jgi:glycosyltransferase involved in cell wall biosynthesis